MRAWRVAQRKPKLLSDDFPQHPYALPQPSKIRMTLTALIY